jgi:glycosyltransferase involved in cell wall biosynthesis
MLPLVSVIIPLYNAGNYIAETIMSCKMQTWSNIEVIIVDDGSTDKSYTTAKSFEDGNVKIYQQKNKGAAAARNYGLSQASGTYIQFLDADDLMSHGKIEAQLSLILNVSGALAAGPTVHFTDGENPFDSVPALDWFKDGSDNTADFLVKQYGGALIGPEYGGMVALHAWLIPRSLIDMAGPWNEELSLDDDGEFMCRVVLEANAIRYAPTAVTYYRKYLSKSNISSQMTLKAHLSLLTSVKLRMRYLLLKRNDYYAKLALSRIFDEIAVCFYPEHPELTKEAQILARQLSKKSYHIPYQNFPTNYISKFFGWKAMRKLSSLKQKWTLKKI